ncbi:GntR family transcriptional regulator [Chitinasiproducens palmae]|uniref:DNA-binding transcriptional regulator, GntR family n=1 Tax=Chitinasiproducens palmae TaxID=1770053 RepID=A0A1H2PLQ0_9BURK|nr:GntR family transcriptional regulator [Chitinasiproducens palmae]SDV47337.1 DNA-binding transcriptional regulator, GntR family [Chitinasiproducens palmae]
MREEGFERQSVQDRAYALLKAMIDDGRLAPGQKLLEAQVAKAFGISRSPARYALQMLHREQRVVEARGRGYEVAGAAREAAPGPRAILDEVKIAAVQQWERVYVELERELCARVMFMSVRIVEERVAEHFGVSRTVVRDVLARMHSVGLVSKDTLGRWLANRVTPDKTHHLYEMRWLLEPEALRQAAPLITAAELESKRQTVVEALDGFPRQGFDTDVVEHDLHVHVLSHCPNGEIAHALARTRMLFVPTRYLFDPVLHIPLSSIEEALQEHLRIYELLLARQPNRAAEALHGHLKAADERWLLRFEGAAHASPAELPAYLVSC